MYNACGLKLARCLGELGSPHARTGDELGAVFVGVRGDRRALCIRIRIRRSRANIQRQEPHRLPTILRPLDRSSFRRDSAPEEIIHLEASETGCDFYGWIATTTSGATVAQVPRGSPGHRWTIRGVNVSTCELARSRRAGSHADGLTPRLNPHAPQTAGAMICQPRTRPQCERTIMAPPARSILPVEEACGHVEADMSAADWGYGTSGVRRGHGHDGPRNP
jgi:hypothetical protein